MDWKAVRSNYYSVFWTLCTVHNWHEVAMHDNYFWQHLTYFQKGKPSSVWWHLLRFHSVMTDIRYFARYVVKYQMHTFNITVSILWNTCIISEWREEAEIGLDSKNHLPYITRIKPNAVDIRLQLERDSCLCYVANMWGLFWKTFPLKHSPCSNSSIIKFTIELSFTQNY